MYKQFPDWLIGCFKSRPCKYAAYRCHTSIVFAGAAFGAIWLYMRKTITANVFAIVLAVVFLLDGWLVANRYLNADDFQEDTRRKNFQPSQSDLQILLPVRARTIAFTTKPLTHLIPHHRPTSINWWVAIALLSCRYTRI